MAEFRLLGPLEAVVEGRPLAIAAAKPRALLALLLLNANRVVSTERLVDELWGDEPPERATKTLQVYVSQLRKELGGRLVTRPPGYELRVDDDELDLRRFKALVHRARGEDARTAAATLRDALALWRGPALREFRSEPFAEREARRLEELRVAALEDRLQAELDAGAGGDLVPELEQLVAAEPVRERPRELLMLALYRAGRQADALELYRKTRERFVDELGLEPGESLRDLEQAMLRQDPALRAPRRERPAEGAPAPPRTPRRRPLVAAAVVAAAAAIGIALAFRGGGSDQPRRADPQLRAFVFTIENFLVQSRAARVEVTHAISQTLACKLTPQRAARRLDHVQRNRQSLLQQLAALHVPAGDDALRSADLLQKAMHASIDVDWKLRDWLRAQRACPQATPIVRADARATRLKRAFVAAFDPLASRFRQRVWQADEL